MTVPTYLDALENNQFFSEALASDDRLPNAIPYLSENPIVKNMIDLTFKRINNVSRDFFDSGENQKFPECPQIVAGLMDSGSCNGVATRYKKRYVIGENWGNFFIIHEIYRRLAQFPEFLPWAGDITNDDPALTSDEPSIFHANIYDTLEKFRSQRSALKYSANPERNRIIHTISSNTFNAIATHEIRHILGGHVDFARRFGVQQIHEASPSGTSSDNALVCQFMEKDADELALLKIAVELFSLFNNVVPEYSIDPNLTNLFLSYDHIVEAISISFEVMFKIFKASEGNANIPWMHAFHPPIPVRRYMLQQSLHMFARNPIHNTLAIPNDKIDLILDSTGNTIDGLFARLFPSKKDQFVNASAKDIHEHASKIKKISRDVFLDLNQYRICETFLDRARLAQKIYF